MIEKREGNMDIYAMTQDELSARMKYRMVQYHDEAIELRKLLLEIRKWMDADNSWEAKFIAEIDAALTKRGGE
jgi:hypothetical protein